MAEVHKLVALFAQRRRHGEASTAQDALVASQWGRCIHEAFYGTDDYPRGVNKFLALESALTRQFEALSADGSGDFWGFAVLLVLHLAQELPQNEANEQADGAPTGNGKVKKRRKRSQPNAPLAFMVVNALRNLAGEEEQLRFCHTQGRTNGVLREFCLKGLADPEFVDQKLVVEVLELFAVVDVEPQVIQTAAESLLASKRYTALIKLLTIFSSVDWSLVSTVRAMTKSKDWSAAELLARTFGGPDDKELAKVLVDEAIAIQDVKRAHRIVYNFGLHDEYPDIDLMYCHDGLMKLIERQRWQMALSFAGNDTSLQRLLFNHVVAAGEVKWAARLAKLLEIPDYKEQVVQMVAQRGSMRTSGLSHSANAAALNGYLSLTLSEEAIIFCDTEESIRGAMDHFFGGKQDLAEGDSSPSYTVFNDDHIVGLDVEWKPTSTKIAATTGSTTTTAVASILQIASSTHVFVVDLLALRGNDFLFDTFLRRLFSCPLLLKTGFGFDSDLKVLHQTFPERFGLLDIAPFLELSMVVSKWLGVSVGNSLSNATSTILGSPLDKKMQMSNWDARPLTSHQRTYAALDAYCLVQMVERLDEINELPAWQDTAAQIHELVYPSPLSDENAADAIALREKHYQDWVIDRFKAQSGDGVTTLLSMQDIEDFWEERKRIHRQKELELLQTGDAVDDEILDTTLAFLDPNTVKELIKQSQDPDHPVTFVAVNAICFFTDEVPCVACIEANCKLDTAQVATICGISRRRIKLATPSECCEYFGFEPGTVPPFGHSPAHVNQSEREAPQIRLYANSTLQHVESLVCGGGSHDSLLWLSSKAYFALVEVEATGDIQRGVSAVDAANATSNAVVATSSTVSTVHDKLDAKREYKFLADSMVARVGKWLRTIGMDVIIWDPYSVPKKTASQDHKASLLALAVCEQRIVLTRDKKLANRRDAGACFVVSSDDPFKQFQEIKTHFALKLVKEEMMSRCSRCNAKGFDIVNLDYVRNQTEDEVHPNVLEIVTEFWVCRVCHKIYWEGPKYDSNYANLLRMFDEDSIVGSDSDSGEH